MNSSFWGKVRIPLLIGLIILVLAAGFFLYERLRGGVDLAIKLPDSEIELGKPFDMEITLANNSANALKNVRLELHLPDGLLLADNPDERIISRGIGDMVNGRMHRETLRVIALPGENPNYKTKLVVYYAPASISADLQKTKEEEARVKKPDASLELSVPDRIFSNEDLEIKTSYKNNELEPEGGNYSLEFKLNYPPNFNAISRDPEPRGENNNWRLEDTGLREGSVAMKGNIELPDNTSFSVRAELVMRILGKEYPVTAVTKNIAVNPSPLAFRVGLGSAKEAVSPGEELAYFIQYKNNASVPLEDAVVSAHLTGEMFDMSTLETGGAADLLTNTLVWSPSQVKALEVLEPNEEGQVSFAIKVKSDYPIRKQSDKNFTLKVDARIESPTVPPPLNINKTANFGTVETKITGRLAMEAGAYFRDAAAKVVNKGPFPPRVGLPTNFTVHWDLMNFGTDLSEVEIRAKLGDKVSFIGKVKNSSGSDLQFDPATREVIWRISELPAGAGALDQMPQAIFQIEATPGAPYIGQYMPLLGPIEIKAKDNFTGLDLGSSLPPLTTRLEKDSTVRPADGLVRQ